MAISFKFDDLKTQRYVNCDELVLERVGGTSSALPITLRQPLFALAY